MLIEETITNGQSIEWSPTATHPAGPDVDQARRIAADAALTYRPKHPKRPKRRQVFQTGPDNWLVVVTGASSQPGCSAGRWPRCWRGTRSRCSPPKRRPDRGRDRKGAARRRLVMQMATAQDRV